MVFVEPVEQLLFLAAESLTTSKKMADDAKENFLEVFSLAKRNKIVSESLTVKTSKMLYPLDAVAASCLTLAIQRYGQNERTLFSFLHDPILILLLIEDYLLNIIVLRIYNLML